MSDIARPYCVSILGSVCVTFGRKKETGYFIEAQNVPSTLTCNRYTKKEEKKWCGYVNVIKDMIMGAMVTMMIMNIDYCSSDIDARND